MLFPTKLDRTCGRCAWPPAHSICTRPRRPRRNPLSQQIPPVRFDRKSRREANTQIKCHIRHLFTPICTTAGGVFAGSGVENRDRCHAPPQYGFADVNLIGLIGERGRDGATTVHPRDLGRACARVGRFSTGCSRRWLRQTSRADTTAMRNTSIDGAKHGLLTDRQCHAFRHGDSAKSPSPVASHRPTGLSPSVFSSFRILLERAARMRRGRHTQGFIQCWSTGMTLNKTDRDACAHRGRASGLGSTHRCNRGFPCDRPCKGKSAVQRCCRRAFPEEV